jgi:uncharacterized membrane protein YeiH
MPLNLTIILDLLGTFAFALSGIRLASGRQIDWFGAYILGLVTAIGGGTIRDLLLDVTPFWMQDGRYFLVTALALMISVLLRDRIFRFGKTLFIFDTIGLGLFTVVGISKSLDAGLPFWISIAMGTITGSFGGVVRDVLLNQVPLLFQKDIYAMACIIGGLVYLGFYSFGVSDTITETVTASSVIITRILAIKFHIHLPILGSSENKTPNTG